MRLVWFSLLLVASVQTEAAVSVIGTSDAQACYEGATFYPQTANEASCNEAIKRGRLSATVLAATYSNRGIIFANHGELDKAIADQNMAISLDPNSARAHINRANDFYRAKRHADAIADYDVAISLPGGELAPAYYNRAQAHKALGHKDAANHDLQQAAMLEPITYKHALEEIEKVP
jgi:tetratricopeptide (TPR) repeat protein